MPRSKTIGGENFPAEVKDDEYVLASGATITPGMLIEVSGATSNGTMEVQPHSTDGGAVGRVMLAALRSFPPRGDKSRTLRKNLDYTEAGEMVEVIHFRRGDSTDNLLLATGENASPGDMLVSDGAGGTRVYVAGTDSVGAVFASADEGRNNTSGNYQRLGGTF